jgi:hypothetical protein
MEYQMIPTKFRSFIMPQHRRVVFATKNIDEDKIGTLLPAHARGKELVKLQKPHPEAWKAWCKEKGIEPPKKRGPKKHGPIAKVLKKRCMWLGPLSTQDEAMLDTFIDNIFGEEWWCAAYANEEAYETCLAMAYAIALDQGV